MSAVALVGPRVAFQGERGAWGDLAIERVWGERAERVARRDFEGVVHAVTTGQADFAVLPMHNAIVGTVTGARDIVMRCGLELHAQIRVPVRHCLLGVPGATLEGVRQVLSQSVALGQCTRFIAERRLLAIPHYDTAGAAREVALRAKRSIAAIASEACARRYGLIVLARGLCDQADNITRFAVLGRT
jgi:prephenate dehydratase